MKGKSGGRRGTAMLGKSPHRPRPRLLPVFGAEGYTQHLCDYLRAALVLRALGPVFGAAA
jgi:hypothetical protein